MFTGLVEKIGTVADIKELDVSESGGKGWSMTVGDAADILVDCHIGDSICINGKKRTYVCLLPSSLFNIFPSAVFS